MRVLLTGASGFIGAAVAAALLRRGQQVVRVLRRPSCSKLAPPLGLVRSCRSPRAVPTWLHPYGPISRNLPVAAAIGLLWALEPRRGRR